MIEKLKFFGGKKEDLTPIEFKDLPFYPQRLFVVKNVPVRVRRGEHAHYQTKQFLICLKGRIKVVLHNGVIEQKFYITEGETILIDRMIWDYQEFMTGRDILLVICSTSYNERDRITDFKEFRKNILSSIL